MSGIPSGLEFSRFSSQSRARLSAVLQTAKDLVTIEDTMTALSTDRSVSAKLLSRWQHQGWLKRVGRGIYAPVPLDAITTEQVLKDPWVLVPALFAPGYVGGWTAAEHWNLTEQLFRSIFVFTARPFRKKELTIQGASFTLTRISEQVLFGTKTLWRGQARVAIADKHRTIVDMLADPATGGGIRHVDHCLQNYFRDPEASPDTLIRYAEQLGNGAVFKRLGFLISQQSGYEALAQFCRDRLTQGNARLDPALPCQRLVKAWRLWIPKNWERSRRVIDRRELLASAGNLGLLPNVVEKDYVLGWLLAGIYNHSALKDSWVFKGGTCLKKCYFETYRFSEDLDFTLPDASHLNIDFLTTTFREIGEWVYEQTGIEMPSDKIYFEVFQNRRDRTTGQGRISYRGPIAPMSGDLPRIKLDLTGDEVLVLPPVSRPVSHPYSDDPDGGIQARCYSYEEVFAEKVRALSERARPRDLYDVINLFRHDEFHPAAQVIHDTLSKKCAFKGIPFPTLAALSSFRAEIEADWMVMLNHQLPALPPADAFWGELPTLFAWLAEGRKPMALAAYAMAAGDVVIRPPAGAISIPGMASSAPLEVIRFAASNRLCVELDYVDERGNRGVRLIEPYSMRRTQAGDVILHALRADGTGHRSYRVNRIKGARATNQTFMPKYAIELTPMGPISAPPAAYSPRVATPHAARSRTTGTSGPTYVYECGVCNQRFEHSKRDATLHAHKNPSGWPCSSRHGIWVDTK